MREAAGLEQGREDLDIGHSLTAGIDTSHIDERKKIPIEIEIIVCG